MLRPALWPSPVDIGNGGLGLHRCVQEDGLESRTQVGVNVSLKAGLAFQEIFIKVKQKKTGWGVEVQCFLSGKKSKIKS